jgi:molybdate transport system regulatory protein
MNQVAGIISEIQTCEDLSLVKVITSNNIAITCLVMGDDRAVSKLTIGKPANLNFKETAVMISTVPELKISVQNRLPCIIHSLNIGDILGQVDLLFNGTMISSIITANACRQLKLKINDPVTALIKTNEISFSSE